MISRRAFLAGTAAAVVTGPALAKKVILDLETQPGPAAVIAIGDHHIGERIGVSAVRAMMRSMPEWQGPVTGMYRLGVERGTRIHKQLAEGTAKLQLNGDILFNTDFAAIEKRVMLAKGYDAGPRTIARMRGQSVTGRTEAD